MQVTEVGSGTRAVLVHGSLSTGEESWFAQQSLAEAGYHLVLPDRLDDSATGAAVGEDYDRDAAEIAALLGDGAHLVGHSYGGLSAMAAAALRPEAVLSLTLVEPSAFGAAVGNPAVDEYMDRFRALWAASDLSDREFLAGFMAELGGSLDAYPPDEVEQAVAITPTLRQQRVVWEACVPPELSKPPFPTLVVSGAHHPAFDVTCAAVVAAIGGAEQAVVPGAGHMVPMVGPPFNDVLLAFWQKAESP